MEITRESLEQRLKALEAQREQFVANVNACNGGIQIVRGLLGDLDREDKDSGEAGEGPVSPEAPDAGSA